MLSRFFFSKLVVVSALSCAFIIRVTNTHAALTSPSTNTTISSWSRPSDAIAAVNTKTTYEAWNSFLDTTVVDPSIDPFSHPLPSPADVVSLNPNGASLISEKTGGAFLTGGNIYSFSVATQFTQSVPSYNLGLGYRTNFLLQFQTIGTEIDYSALTISSPSMQATLLSSLGTHSELSRSTINSPGGATDVVDTKFEFSVPGNDLSYTLNWGASGASMSLDQVSLDTSVTVVPEPSTWGLFLFVGLIGAGFLLPRTKTRSLAEK
jgi:hypothetical protein